MIIRKEKKLIVYSSILAIFSSIVTLLFEYSIQTTKIENPFFFIFILILLPLSFNISIYLIIKKLSCSATRDFKLSNKLIFFALSLILAGLFIVSLDFLSDPHVNDKWNIYKSEIILLGGVYAMFFALICWFLKRYSDLIFRLLTFFLLGMIAMFPFYFFIDKYCLYLFFLIPLFVQLIISIYLLVIYKGA
jgi:hypothetical protein